MKTSLLIHAAIGAIALLALAASGTESPAQKKPAMATTVLLRTTLSGDENKDVILASAELAPGGSTGRHTHPGDEYATVIEGSVEILAQGREPRRVNAGESYHNAKGLVHETRNIGSAAVRIVATFVIDKGQPMMTAVE